MPPHRFPLGPGEMLVDAYLVTDGDEAAQAAWKRAHPDWFVAGSWTPPARRLAGSATGADRDGWPQRGRAPGERSSRWERGETGFGTVLDPASLSVADFMATAAAARVGSSGWPGRYGLDTGGDESGGPGGFDTGIMLAQVGPPRPLRMPGGGRPRTMQEELLERRFNDAIGRIRRLEPRNRELEFVRDPTRAPPEPTVLRVEQEARAAEARGRGEGGAAPLRAEVARPPEPYQSTIDIMAPGELPVGYNSKGAAPAVRTVNPQTFDKLQRQMRVGAEQVPNPRYGGTWYRRLDGFEFGLRYSGQSGWTIDVSDRRIERDFKVHQKSSI